MSLTARDIAEITRLLEDSSFDELELEIDGLKVHLKRGATGPVRADLDLGRRPAGRGDNGSTPSPAATASPETAAAAPHLVEVRAPLLGTFYRAPKPGAAPFVDTGARVEPETVIGIIEVMKLMNTVRAGASGIVQSIRARDGALVEYGETLLVIDTREPP